MYNNDKELFEALKRGSKHALEQAYLENKSIFIGYFKKQHHKLIVTDSVEDLYHTCIIILVEYALKDTNKTIELKHSLSTFLISIGRYTLINNQKKKVKEYGYLETIKTLQDKRDEWFVIHEETNKDKIQKAIIECLKIMNNTCEDLLTLFLLDGYDTDEVLQIKNYRNKKTLISTKSRCLKLLRECVAKRINRTTEI